MWQTFQCISKKQLQEIFHTVLYSTHHLTWKIIPEFAAVWCQLN